MLRQKSVFWKWHVSTSIYRSSHLVAYHAVHRRRVSKDHAHWKQRHHFGGADQSFNRVGSTSPLGMRTRVGQAQETRQSYWLRLNLNLMIGWPSSSSQAAPAAAGSAFYSPRANKGENTWLDGATIVTNAVCVIELAVCCFFSLPFLGIGGVKQDRRRLCYNISLWQSNFHIQELSGCNQFDPTSASMWIKK